MKDRIDIKEVLDRNICPVCSKQDCPYLTENKNAKEMMEAYRNGDTKTATKIYIKHYAQHAAKNNELYREKIKLHDSVTQSLTRGNNSNSPLNITPIFNSAIASAMSTLKPSNSLAGNIAPVSSFNLNAIAGSKSESLGAIVGRSLGLGIGLATHSPPAGAPGLDTLHGFSQHDFNHLTRNTDSSLTSVGKTLRLPSENKLREVAKTKGFVDTYATTTEKVINGARTVELTKTNTPIKTRVVEARPTDQKGVFSYSVPNESKERQIQVGKPNVLAGNPTPIPRKVKELPGDINDIHRFNNIPLDPPSFSNLRRSHRPFVIVFPWEIGVKPIYIVSSKKKKDKAKDEPEKKREGVKVKGHDYHPAPKTEEIKGFGEIKKGKKKTPKQGGGGKRERWIGDKGRKIYEWDSQHGEIEGYRGSDGQHLGAFDPKTGKQLKPADPKRNIKKYL